MKKLLFLIALIISISHLKAQDTLNYELVDAFRIDKKFSPEILNYLIKKGELTKSEVDEQMLNIFQSVYVIDIFYPENLNQNGIYRFGRITSHGDVSLLIKSEDQIEIINNLNYEEIQKKVGNFLQQESNEFDDPTIKNYQEALNNWFVNRSY
ncbi:hypothetical protein [Cyclobacterium amurskyense]|uniref:Uncharacterized protein n=1 Tax=Cyclobacterium amurskyense TaxID=320787 RepID=A0A0H4PIZ6_9BACT|nr:hypothetical protein [Cyclobacterium amurskyense]AKP52913.1 hypothetical protein CA2015_3533 [Cyclobacterium amurskyense]|tara:strand:+ start:1535 stop:1993 length:459 start_codon:yes stop_codon:yes gene_type:complete